MSKSLDIPYYKVHMRNESTQKIEEKLIIFYVKSMQWSEAGYVKPAKATDYQLRVWSYRADAVLEAIKLINAY